VLKIAKQASSANTGPAAYRPRRPATTLLHRTVREHLQTHIAAAGDKQDNTLTGADWMLEDHRAVSSRGQPASGSLLYLGERIH
jgi:hypothetical protein